MRAAASIVYSLLEDDDDLVGGVKDYVYGTLDAPTMMAQHGWRNYGGHYTVSAPAAWEKRWPLHPARPKGGNYSGQWTHLGVECYFGYHWDFPYRMIWSMKLLEVDPQTERSTDFEPVASHVTVMTAQDRAVKLRAGLDACDQVMGTVNTYSDWPVSDQLEEIFREWKARMPS